MITGLYVGVLAIMMALLVVNIVRKRFKNRVGLGDGGVDELQQAIRIHGNFTEMVPMILIIMVLFEVLKFSPFLIHVFGVVLILSRVLHFMGVSKTPYSSKGRAGGTMLALLLLVIGGLLLILNFMTGIIF